MEGKQMKRQVYLDHNATTPPDHRVVQAMLPYLMEHFGNPASKHEWGYEALEAVNQARSQVAKLIGASPQEIIFTSGATESNNIALLGYQRSALVFSSAEHSSVLQAAQVLAGKPAMGWVARMDPDQDGRVNLDELSRLLNDCRYPATNHISSRALISVMLANNEVGSANDIREISRYAKEHGHWLHVDASQGLGYLPFDVSEYSGICMASLSSHKMYGPKGVGALYIRKDCQRYIQSPVAGGGQEQGIRSGTLNVPAIVGFGEACRIMQKDGTFEATRLTYLRGMLYDLLLEVVDHQDFNGAFGGYPPVRLPHNLNVWIRGAHIENLMMSLSDLALSTGSACSAHSSKPSHVLEAMFPESPQRARSSIRMSVGRFTTEDDVRYAGKRICEEVRRFR